MTPNYSNSIKNRLTRRAFLKLAGLGGGAAILAACTPSATPTSPAGEDSGSATTPSAADLITMSFWTPGGSEVFCGGFNTIAANYHNLHPNIQITDAECYTGDQAFKEVLLANIAGGTPPDMTILWDSPVAFAARGVLTPLDEMMALSQYSQLANWPPGVLASCQFEGKTYGLPATAGSYGIFYNEELFESKGISSKREDFPKTWDELRRLSKEFTVWNGDTLESAGFIPWSNPDDLYSMAVELAIWSALNGGQLFDAQNLKFTLDSEQNIEMWQFAMDWWEEEYKGDLIKIRTAANWAGYGDSQGRPPSFQEGKLAMMTNGFWFTADMYGSELKFERWNVAQFPVGPSGKETKSGFWPNWLVIPAGSKQVQEAFNYLDYMTVEGLKTWFQNIPDTPANKLFPEGLLPQTVVEKRGDAFAQEIDTFFRGQRDIAAPMWDSPIHDFALDQIGRAAEQILSKAATPKDALAEAQSVCEAELQNVLKK